MKVWKKNLIAAAILVTVCAGIYVNWRYTEDQAAANLTDTLDTEKVMSDDNLVLSEDMAAISAGEDVATTSTDYFAAVRLSRQQARDNAVNLLQERKLQGSGVRGRAGTDRADGAERSPDREPDHREGLCRLRGLHVRRGHFHCGGFSRGRLAAGGRGRYRGHRHGAVRLFSERYPCCGSSISLCPG